MKTLCLMLAVLLCLAFLPALSESIPEEKVAGVMMENVLQEYPEYADVQLEIRNLNYMPAAPDAGQDVPIWTADIFRKTDDFYLFHVTWDMHHDSIRPDDIRCQYFDPSDWTNIIWHWENKVNMGPIRCWPIEYKAAFDAWMRASLADSGDVLRDSYAALFLSHVNSLPDEHCLPMEEAIAAAQEFVASATSVSKKDLQLRRTLQQFWADDPENPFWCITICKNERTFLRDYLVCVDAHTGQCQWMHVDEKGVYQIGPAPESP